MPGAAMKIASRGLARATPVPKNGVLVMRSIRIYKQVERGEWYSVAMNVVFIYVDGSSMTAGITGMARHPPDAHRNHSVCAKPD